MTRKIGRPSKIDEVRDDIVAMVRRGIPITTACEAAGIAQSTYYDWLGKNPEFSAELTQARAEGRSELVEKLLAAVDRDGNPDWRALAWYLERTDRETYGKHVELAVQPVAPAEEITPEEARKRLRALPGGK